MKEVKAATPIGSDEADGIKREWYRVGRSDFAVTESGELLYYDGMLMAQMTAGGYVTLTDDQRAYRVAEAIRRWHAAYAAINREMDEHFPALEREVNAAIANQH